MRKNRKICGLNAAITICIYLLLSACTHWVDDINSLPLATETRAIEHVYTLAPGDTMEIIVFGEEELSGEFRIDSDGSITMPLIGTITVAGLSVIDAETEVKKALSNGYLRQPYVSFKILNFRPFYILGEIKAPGQYSYIQDLTVVTAAGVAGGFTYRAQQKDFIIYRGGESTNAVKANKDTLVYPDDVVIVRERFF